MKTRFLNTYSSLLLLLVFLFAGCDSMEPESNIGQEELPPPVISEEPPPPAPPIFPDEILSLDMSLFEARPAGKHASDGSYANFLAAAIRAGAVTVVNGTILTPPAIFTGALADAEPTFVEPVNESEDAMFVWEKENVELGTSLNGLRLVATINQENTPSDTNNAGINWELFVTGFEDDRGQRTQDFLMLDARTNVTTLDGRLELFYPIEGASKMAMEGNYSIDVENEVYSLAFTIPEEVKLVGGLSTTITSANNTLATLDIMTKSGVKQLIEWDSESGQGTITADDYNNGQRACWDAELRNADCQG